MTPFDALAALKQKGVDTDKLLSQLESEGYDTSSLKPHISAQQQSVEGNWEGIQPAPLVVPNNAPAQGLGALGELAGGQGLQQASQVAQGQAQPQSIQGNVGRVIGSAVSPLNIASAALMPSQGLQTAQEAGQAIKSGVGDVINTLRGPGEAEARLAADNFLNQNAPKAASKAQQYIAQTGQTINDSMTQLKTSLKQLPIQIDQKKALLEAFQRQAGRAMGKAEPLVDMNQLTKDLNDPKALQQLADTMSRWSKQTGQQLADSGVPNENIQYLRKFGQEAGNKLDGMVNAIVQKGRNVASEALENRLPEFADARQKYLQISDALDKLPADAAQKKAALQQGLIQGQNQLKQLSTEAKSLIAAAKNADAEQLVSIKQQANDLIQEGLKHDRYVQNLWTAVKAAGIAGLGAAGIKKLGSGY